MKTSTEIRAVARFSSLLCAGAAAFAVAGCESEESSAIAKAQACLDVATPAQAPQCSAMVAGIESSAAYAIRCSVHYLAQGFTGTRFATAFQKIKDSGSGGAGDPMAAAMGYLIFPATTGAHGSDQTLSDCNKSEIRSLQRIALLTSTATYIATQTGATLTPAADGSIDPTQMNDAIQQFSGDPAQIGNLAIQASAAFCNAGSSLATNQICQDLQAALTAGGGGANPSAIGTQLLTLLQQ